MENSFPSILKIEKTKIENYFYEYEYKCLKDSTMILDNCNLKKNKYESSFTFFFYKNIILSKKNKITQEGFNELIDVFFSTRGYSSENGFNEEMETLIKNKLKEFHSHFFNLDIDKNILQVRKILLEEEEKEEKEISNEVYELFVKKGVINTEKHINKQLEKLRKKHLSFLEEKEEYNQLKKDIDLLDKEVEYLKEKTFDEELLIGEDKEKYEKIKGEIEKIEEEELKKEELKNKILSYENTIEMLRKIPSEERSSSESVNLNDLILGLEESKKNLKEVEDFLNKKNIEKTKKEFENLEEEFKEKYYSYAFTSKNEEKAKIKSDELFEKTLSLANYQNSHISYFRNLVKSYDYLILCENNLDETLSEDFSKQFEKESLDLFEEMKI